MTSTATLFREWIAAPGENLLQSQPPFLSGARFARFSEDTGLDDRDVVLSTICSIPLPRYAPVRYGRRRWEGQLAEFMWHPLMWLPDVIASRRMIELDNGETWFEDDDTWAVRLITELTMCGMYDQTSGMWVDVLNLHGIDINEPQSVERVERWLRGADDPILDAIDLTEYLVYPADPAWSTAVATEIVPKLRVIAWWVAADSLLETVTSLDPGLASVDKVRFHRKLAEVAVLCDVSFETIPEWEVDRAANAIATWNGSEVDLTDRLLPWMIAQLDLIRDNFEDEVAGEAESAAEGFGSDEPVDPYAE